MILILLLLLSCKEKTREGLDIVDDSKSGILNSNRSRVALPDETISPITPNINQSKPVGTSTPTSPNTKSPISTNRPVGNKVDSDEIYNILLDEINLHLVYRNGQLAISQLGDTGEMDFSSQILFVFLERDGVIDTFYLEIVIQKLTESLENIPDKAHNQINRVLKECKDKLNILNEFTKLCEKYLENEEGFKVEWAKWQSAHPNESSNDYYDKYLMLKRMHEYGKKEPKARIVSKPASVQEAPKKREYDLANLQNGPIDNPTEFLAALKAQENDYDKRVQYWLDYLQLRKDARATALAAAKAEYPDIQINNSQHQWISQAFQELSTSKEANNEKYRLAFVDKLIEEALRLKNNYFPRDYIYTYLDAHWANGRDSLLYVFAVICDFDAVLAYFDKGLNDVQTHVKVKYSRNAMVCLDSDNLAPEIEWYCYSDNTIGKGVYYIENNTGIFQHPDPTKEKRKELLGIPKDHNFRADIDVRLK